MSFASKFHVHTSSDVLRFHVSELKAGIFYRRAMVDRPAGPLLPEGNLTFWCTSHRKDRLFYRDYVLRKLCYYYAPLRPHRK